MTQVPDDQPERPGWHVTRGRTPDGRFGWVTLAHHGRPHPPLSLRQTVVRAIVFDTLLVALYIASLMRMGQQGALTVGLLATPLAVALWSQWHLIRDARRHD